MKMRYYIGILLLIISSLTYADEVRCYSNGHLIYHRQGYKIAYTDGMFAFTEANTNRIVFTSADCIVKIDV
jgi:hypothetical protein